MMPCGRSSSMLAYEAQKQVPGVISIIVPCPPSTLSSDPREGSLWAIKQYTTSMEGMLKHEWVWDSC